MFRQSAGEGFDLPLHVGGFAGVLPTQRGRSFSRGQTIWEPGASEIVGFVVSGVVKLVVNLPDGRSNIVGMIEAPGFFGRLFEASAEFTIEAATDVVASCFDRSAFENQLTRSRALEHRIHLENLHQLDEAHERITVLAGQNIMERLTTYLALRLIAEETRSTGASRRDAIIHVPINRRDFAGYLGTTVETVSRNIQALVRRGTIAVIDSSNFRLLRRSDLFKLAGQDEDDLVEMARSRAQALRRRTSPLPPDQRAAEHAYLEAAE